MTNKTVIRKNTQTGTKVLKKARLQKPTMYQVIIHNDDYTPMEFVVELLEFFFQKNRVAATELMLEVHTRGKSACGVYPKEIAETKSKQVNEYAQTHGHPLLSTFEKYHDGDKV